MSIINDFVVIYIKVFLFTVKYYEAFCNSLNVVIASGTIRLFALIFIVLRIPTVFKNS